MRQLSNEYVTRPPLKVKILQFGEGNFLRAFVDWMVDKTNKAGLMYAGVVIVQPLREGMADQIAKQDGLYHVLLQGIEKGMPREETALIECVLDAINPYVSYEKYKTYFLEETLEFIISNTTEAGISRVADENIFALPPASFPGKITALLYQRYLHFKGDATKGLHILCCELIENNAIILKQIVHELIHANNLPLDFAKWIETCCTFSNSLVDRIVPGFPKDNIEAIQQKLGFKDDLVVVGEYFHLWAIEAPKLVQDKLPFDKAGLNVLWLDDLKAFRDKKVRILNGAHTALVPLGLLSGLETVKEAFENKAISGFIRDMVALEVVPNIPGDKKSLNAFADQILERFFNPFIRHYLKDISLNSLSKWMTRIYPSFIDSFHRTGTLPKYTTFSLAALIVLYRGRFKDFTFVISDTAEHVSVIKSIWESDGITHKKVRSFLGQEKIWGIDLTHINGLTEQIAEEIDSIENSGITGALNLLGYG